MYDLNKNQVERNDSVVDSTSLNQIDNEILQQVLPDFPGIREDIRIIQRVFKDHGLSTICIDNLMVTIPFFYFILEPIYEILTDKSKDKSDKIQQIETEITKNLQTRFNVHMEYITSKLEASKMLDSIYKSTAKTIATVICNETSFHTLTDNIRDCRLDTFKRYPYYTTFEEANANSNEINNFSYAAQTYTHHYFLIHRTAKKYILTHGLTFDTSCFIETFQSIGQPTYRIPPTNNWLSQFIHQIPKVYTSLNTIRDCTVFEFKHTDSCNSINPNALVKLTDENIANYDDDLRTLFNSSQNTQHETVSTNGTSPNFQECINYQYIKIYVSQKSDTYFSLNDSCLTKHSLTVPKTRTLTNGCTVTRCSLTKSMERHMSHNPITKEPNPHVMEWRKLIQDNTDLVNALSKALLPSNRIQYFSSLNDIEDAIFTME